MKGAHRVIVETKKIKYDFVVKRNITILTGDSGSGKTVLIDYIRDYRRYGADSGVFVSCDCDCRTLDNEDWERQLEEITGSIVFIDEGNRFLPTQRFAELVQQSDNYFVIATREKLPMLPYSIKEIYGFRESGKFRHTKQKYNEIYHLYGEISNSDSIEPESFEWLLLASNTIPDVNVSAILEQPENYIDSAKYISWERYFTDLLIESTKDSPLWRYAKKKLPSVYLSPKVVKAVKNMMQLVAWD